MTTDYETSAPTEAEPSNPPSREAIKMLETANIPPKCKADMLLVKLGLRPATIIELTELYPLGGEVPIGNEHKAVDYMTAAHSLGLSIDTDTYNHDFEDRYLYHGGDPARLPEVIKKIGMGDHPQRVHFNIFVGKSNNAVEVLKHAWQPENADDQACGLALGYPKTAVESFANGTTQHMNDARAAAFGQFKLSSDSAKAEAEEAIALTWANAIQEVSPVIYDQVMERMK